MHTSNDLELEENQNRVSVLDNSSPESESVDEKQTLKSQTVPQQLVSCIEQVSDPFKVQPAEKYDQQDFSKSLIQFSITTKESLPCPTHDSSLNQTKETNDSSSQIKLTVNEPELVDEDLNSDGPLDVSNDGRNSSISSKDSNSDPIHDSVQNSKLLHLYIFILR
jgi:hypothetical protein